MGVRVFITTTEGPALIQRIAAEDSDIPPVICLNGTTETLPISEAYGRFVRRGTGVVAGLTGHDSYRIDLDRPVDGGSSWQLGVLLAHLLQAEGRLAGPGERAEATILATGEVDRDLILRPVGHIDRKLSSSAGLRQDSVAAGGTCLFLAPADDDTEDPAVTSVSSLAEAARLLNLPSPDGAAIPALAATGADRSGRRWAWVPGGVVVMALIAGLYWQRERIEMALSPETPTETAVPAPRETPPAAPVQPAEEDMTVTVETFRAPVGFTCRSLRFAQLDLVAGDAVPLTAGRMIGGDEAEICRIRYSIAPKGEAATAIRAVWRSGDRKVTNQGMATRRAPLVLDVDLADGHADDAALDVLRDDADGHTRTWRHRIVR